MRPSILHSVCQAVRRQTAPVARIRRRKLSALATQLEPKPRTRPEPIHIPHEQSPKRPRPDPHILVASELTHIRQCMLNLLGKAHPGLAGVAEYYFLYPSDQLRSLLVLLFARATNGLGRNWDQKEWEAECESSMGMSEVFDQPLSLSDVLYEWNPSMPDHTASFEAPFTLRQSIPRPPFPPPRPTPRSAKNLAARFNERTSLLPNQIRLAQVVEMIHVASLLHNGITPNSDASRQADEEGFGNKLAILAGDFMLGRASLVLSRLPEGEVLELIASAISNQVEGELLCMGEVKTPELGILPGPKSLPEAWERYLRKTYFKTASLMAKGARSAVILGGCRDGEVLREAAYVYGRNLGIAYQLAEDARGMKQLQPGLATGPALFASEECPSLLPLIERKFANEGDTEMAIEYIQSTAGVERTHLLAQAYAEKAREALDLIPDSETKLALDALVDIAVERT